MHVFRSRSVLITVLTTAALLPWPLRSATAEEGSALLTSCGPNESCFQYDADPSTASAVTVDYVGGK